MKKINITFILLISLGANFIICGTVDSQESRNPFKDWFPIIKIEKEKEKPIQIEERKFDVSAYHLDGVVWGEYKPKAIINNIIYNVGDKLGEAEIIKIGKDGVTVNFYDKEYIIRTKNLTLEQKSEQKDEEGG